MPSITKGRFAMPSRRAERRTRARVYYLRYMRNRLVIPPNGPGRRKKKK